MKKLVMKTLKQTAVVGFGLAAALTASAAYTDGHVTMHGAGCKPALASSANVTYGEALFVGDKGAESVTCPLANHWGGGSDWPFALGTTTVYVVTKAPASSVSCTIVRMNGYGQRVEVRSAVAVGADSSKRVTIPEFTKERSTSKHNYVLQCSLPPSSALFNIQYTTTAVP